MWGWCARDEKDGEDEDEGDIGRYREIYGDIGRYRAHVMKRMVRTRMRKPKT